MGFRRYYPPTGPPQELRREDFLNTLHPELRAQILRQDHPKRNHVQTDLHWWERDGAVKPHLRSK